MNEIAFTASPYAMAVAGAFALVVLLIAIFGGRNSGGPVVLASSNDGIERRISAIETQVQKLDGDVMGMRETLKHLPTKDAVHRLEVQMTKLEGQVEGIAESAASTGRITERIENYLLSIAAHNAVPIKKDTGANS